MPQVLLNHCLTERDLTEHAYCVILPRLLCGSEFILLDRYFVPIQVLATAPLMLTAHR